MSALDGVMTLLSSNSDVVGHTVEQLSAASHAPAVQRVAGTSHLWRTAAHAALGAKGLPLQVSKQTAVQKHEEPMDLCAVSGGGCLVAGWSGLYELSADGNLMPGPFEWSSAPTATKGPNPADPDGSQAEMFARVVWEEGETEAYGWEEDEDDENVEALSRSRLKPVMAAAVASDGTVFTISEPVGLGSPYASPEYHRLEKFAASGAELLAFVDFTSGEEAHVGAVTMYEHDEPADEPAGPPAPYFPGQVMLGQNLAHTAQKVFVADTRNHRIAAFDASTLVPTCTFGYEGLTERGAQRAAKMREQRGGLGPGQYPPAPKEHAPGALKAPRGMAIMGDELVVTDTGNNRLQIFHTNGVFARSVEEPFSRLRLEDVAAGHGNLYVTGISDELHEQIAKVGKRDAFLRSQIIVLVLTPAGHPLQRILLPGGISPGPCLCVSGSAVWVARRSSGWSPCGQINLLTARDAALSPSAAVDAGAACAKSVATFDAALVELQRSPSTRWAPVA